MRTIIPVAALLACLATGAPAAAQSTQDPAAASKPLPYDRGYDKDTPRTRAINDNARPGVEDANIAVLGQSTQQTRGGTVDETRYSADMAAYRAALRERRRTINRDEAHYARQSRAYAEAMADWRVQVAACERGSNTACRMPAPDPANYW